jgi:hypothetical protein
MRQPDFIIKIAADSVEKLRRSDVERVLENCSDEELEPTCAWILANREDLSGKIREELYYQLTERRMMKTCGA